MKITLEQFTRIKSYEDCPIDVELLVWTGDSFDVTYVEYNSGDGTAMVANGVEFIAFIELPDRDDADKHFLF